ncbi:MAG TPA: hypothetical protein VMT34_06070, partial [Aggregatilineales bacterium]|nr:hypothetical protein [Aggregatilineales bacterium]
MKLQVISLEPYDDVVSVRDRLSFVQADRVLLVWPTAASTRKRILCRKLDLVLIQRESARRHTKLALVTSDPDVIDNAEDLNISVFASVQAAQRGRWRHPLNSVFVDRSGRPEASPDPYELRLVASRLKRLTPQQRRVRAIVRQLVVVVLIAAV